MQMETEVLVIGAGQAGLAAGFRLKRAGIAHVIVEALPRLGDVWRNRYASLTLFTPRRFSQLPGLDLAGDPDGYPSGTEFADYLGAYAAAHGLTVRTGVRVLRLGKSQRFRADLSDGTRIDADRVVIATGGFQRALRPALAAGFGEGVVQLTAEDYRRPDQLPGGPVLVWWGTGQAGATSQRKWRGRGLCSLPPASRASWCRNGCSAAASGGGWTRLAFCAPRRRRCRGGSCGRATPFPTATAALRHLYLGESL
jgi:cation diffusion facilitator CzcD-associated flavoprotein CzcO